MRRRVFSVLFSLVIGATVLVAPLAFLNSGEVARVKADDSTTYKPFHPQAGSNFRLAQVNSVSYSGLETLASIYTLARTFWSTYEIALSGRGVEGGSNSMGSACEQGVYIDLFFGRGFGSGSEDTSGAFTGTVKGSVYTMEIKYYYTATGENEMVSVYMSSGLGYPLLDVKYYPNQTTGNNGVNLSASNSFSDDDYYLMGYQAYVKVSDSGFNDKFCIPMDFSLQDATSNTENPSSDYRTLTNYVYTYLALNLTWSTSYSGGSSGGSSSGGSSGDSSGGSSEPGSAVWQRGYDSGYAKGKEDGISIGSNSGYSSGYNEGYNKGYDKGKIDASKEKLIIGDTEFFTGMKPYAVTYVDGTSRSFSSLSYDPVYDDYGCLNFNYFLTNFLDPTALSPYDNDSVSIASFAISCPGFEPIVDNFTFKVNNPSTVKTFSLIMSNGNHMYGTISEEGFIEVDKTRNYFPGIKCIGFRFYLYGRDGVKDFSICKYNTSDSAGYRYGYKTGYEKATDIEGSKQYAKGLRDGSSTDISTTWFSSFLSGFASILNVTLFGSIKLWHLVSIPLLFGAIFLVFKFIK